MSEPNLCERHGTEQPCGRCAIRERADEILRLEDARESNRRDPLALSVSELETLWEAIERWAAQRDTTYSPVHPPFFRERHQQKLRETSSQVELIVQQAILRRAASTPRVERFEDTMHGALAAQVDSAILDAREKIERARWISLKLQTGLDACELGTATSVAAFIKELDAYSSNLERLADLVATLRVHWLSEKAQ